MPSGRTSPAKIRLATSNDISPQIELQLDAPAKLGQKVRVTVFDEALFRKGPLAREYDRVFSVFIGKGTQVMPAAVRDPASLITDGENGVLLTLEAEVVDEVPKRAERKHRKWAFGAASNVRTCSPKALLLDVAFGLRDKNNEIAFGPLIRLPRSANLEIRRLVVVVSVDASSEILYSNAWRTPDFIKFNGQAGPTLLNSKAVEAAIPAQVGGLGEGTGAPAPAGRALADTDFTGTYEAFTSDKQQLAVDLPLLMVQLNLAGNAVAGWWAPPPTRITNLPHHRLPQAVPPAPIAPGTFGVLLGHFEDGEYKILWGPSDGSKDPRPEIVGASRFQPNDATGTGTLRVVSEERLELILTRGNESARFFLAMTEPTPRWSNRTRDDVVRAAARDSSRVRDEIRTHQQQPIPLVFWHMMQQDFEATGFLGRLIVLHETTTLEPPIQRIHREAISNYLLGLTGVPVHAEAVLAHFTLFSGGVGITINDITKSTYDWLRKIADDFTSRLVEGGLEPDVAVGRLPQGFIQSGVVPPVAFVYKFDFFPIGGGVKVGVVGAGAYVFDVDVSRVRLRNDVEIPNEPDDPWEKLPKKRKQMTGGFGDIGIGLGVELKFGGASNFVRQIQFKSFHNLDPGEFNEATFWVSSASAATVSALLLSAKGAESAVMILTVVTKKDGREVKSTRMVAGVEKFFVKPDPKKPTSQLVKKFKPFSANIFSLTLGKGWMFEGRGTPVEAPTTDTDPKETTGEATYNAQVFFRKNSATLEGTNLSALEEALAVERAIFVSGGGHATAAGHASPEGPDNDGLSQRRAENVIKIMTDAFAGELAVSGRAIGFGHRAALADGLQRPESLPPAERASVRGNEPAVFIQYRTVMLWVNGFPLIQVRVSKALIGN
jgi:hypothetical protein